MNRPTPEKVKQLLAYDPISGVLTWKFNIRNGKGAGYVRIKAGDIAGSINKHPKHGYRIIKIKHIGYRAAHIAWVIMTGDWPSQKVDHRNGNRADDSWSNLRAADDQQNAMNQKTPKNNTSGCKGVHWQSNIDKWAARISFQSRRINLGFFKEKEDAIAARKRAEQIHFGEWARL